MIKKLTRMIIFSATALYLNSLLNKGFIIHDDPKKIMIAILIIAAIYYIVGPILRVIFFPVNLLTVGVFSTIVYLLIFNYLIEKFKLIKITHWVFPGADLGIIIIPKTAITVFLNKIISALSISLFISLMEFLL
jgi:uncharacterized membrane protein YvlD (DUF360 family)